MKIAIFGGGHGVCAAARLSDADHEAGLGHRWRHDAAAPAPAGRAGTFTSAALNGPQPRPIAAPPSRAGAEGLPLCAALALRAAAQRDNGRTMTAATLLLRVAQARQLNPLIRML